MYMYMYSGIIPWFRANISTTLPTHSADLMIGGTPAHYFSQLNLVYAKVVYTATQITSIPAGNFHYTHN